MLRLGAGTGQENYGHRREILQRVKARGKLYKRIPGLILRHGIMPEITDKGAGMMSLTWVKRGHEILNLIQPGDIIPPMAAFRFYRFGVLLAGYATGEQIHYIETIRPDEFSVYDKDVVFVALVDMANGPGFDEEMARGDEGLPMGVSTFGVSKWFPESQSPKELSALVKDYLTQALRRSGKVTP